MFKKTLLAAASVALLINVGLASADYITKSPSTLLKSMDTTVQLFTDTSTDLDKNAFILQQTGLVEDKVTITAQNDSVAGKLAYSDGAVLDNDGLYAKILAPENTDSVLAYGYGAQYIIGSTVAAVTDLRAPFLTKLDETGKYDTASVASTTLIKLNWQIDNENPSGTFTAHKVTGILFSSGTSIG